MGLALTGRIGKLVWWPKGHTHVVGFLYLNFMEQTKLDKIMQHVGYTITTIAVVVFGIYIISMNGVSSCSGDFVRGNMSATNVKESCSGLDKQDLLDAVEERYPNGNLTEQEIKYKLGLIRDIEETYR